MMGLAAESDADADHATVAATLRKRHQGTHWRGSSARAAFVTFGAACSGARRVGSWRLRSPAKATLCGSTICSVGPQRTGLERRRRRGLRWTKHQRGDRQQICASREPPRTGRPSIGEVAPWGVHPDWSFIRADTSGTCPGLICATLSRGRIDRRPKPQFTVGQAIRDERRLSPEIQSGAEVSAARQTDP
jgi:hypothetical protein